MSTSGTPAPAMPSAFEEEQNLETAITKTTARSTKDNIDKDDNGARIKDGVLWSSLQIRSTLTMKLPPFDKDD
jgi:hypothetical protein